MEVTTKQLQTLFNVQGRTITKWVNEGGCPKIDRGRFDLREVIAWHEERWEARLQRVTDNASKNDDSHDRWKAARAEIVELELAEKKGEVVLFEDVKKRELEFCARFKRMLLALPREAALGVAHKPAAECEQILVDHAHAILKRLVASLEADQL